MWTSLQTPRQTDAVASLFGVPGFLGADSLDPAWSEHQDQTLLLRWVLPGMKPSRISLRNRADKLFRDLVRARGRCEAAGFDDLACGGPLQTAHLVSRKYLSVRWDPGNAACLCAAHHVYLTHNPIAHIRFVEKYLGPEEWWALRRRAEAGYGPPDYSAIIARLEAA